MILSLRSFNSHPSSCGRAGGELDVPHVCGWSSPPGVSAMHDGTEPLFGGCGNSIGSTDRNGGMRIQRECVYRVCFCMGYLTVDC